MYFSVFHRRDLFRFPERKFPYFSRYCAFAALVFFFFLLPAIGYSSERHFTYSYESFTQPPGSAEFEPWVTVRGGRESFYLRFDHRIEFEFGAAKNLQFDLYLNFSNISSVGRGDKLFSRFKWEGISATVKWKLSDPVANPLGMAFYFEQYLKPGEIESELKLIFDKRIGNFLVVLNLTGELELEFEKPSEIEREFLFIVDGGLAYFLKRNFSLGLEFRAHTEFTPSGWEHTAFFLGPVLSWHQKSWWLALTFLFQLPGVGEDGGGLILDEHEYLSARAIVGFGF